MGPNPVRSTAATTLLLLAACSTDEPATAPSFAKGAAGAAPTVAPTAVEFSVPPGGSEVVTFSVQYVTTVSSATSNASCATVSPTSLPSEKPPGSSVYIARFTITAVGAGNCTITLTDKKGKSTSVAVTVGAPLPDRIVYTSNVGGGSDIWVMDLDGSNKTQLTTTGASTADLYPTLSADGRRILFMHSPDAFSWAATIMNVDGTNPTVVPLPTNAGPAFFSPNGKQLVYAQRVGDWDRLFKADVSGANQVQLTFAPNESGAHALPSWGGSLPGRIVYKIESPRSIWIMNADGTGQTMVTDNSDSWFHSGTFPTISPDGTRIAFDCSPVVHTFDICLINADGSGGKVRLTDSDGDNRSPRWTRDGRIYFYSTRDGNHEIYIMNADGTGQVNLTNSAADEGTVVP